MLCHCVDSLLILASCLTWNKQCKTKYYQAGLRMFAFLDSSQVQIFFLIHTCSLHAWQSFWKIASVKGCHSTFVIVNNNGRLPRIQRHISKQHKKRMCFSWGIFVIIFLVWTGIVLNVFVTQLQSRIEVISSL